MRSMKMTELVFSCWTNHLNCFRWNSTWWEWNEKSIVVFSVTYEWMNMRIIRCFFLFLILTRLPFKCSVPILLNCWMRNNADQSESLAPFHVSSSEHIQSLFSAAREREKAILHNKNDWKNYLKDFSGWVKGKMEKW